MYATNILLLYTCTVYAVLSNRYYCSRTQQLIYNRVHDCLQTTPCPYRVNTYRRHTHRSLHRDLLFGSL